MSKPHTYGDIRLITPPGTLVFPDVFAKRMNPNKNKEEFSATILIPKSTSLSDPAPGSQMGLGQCVRHCLTDSFGAGAVDPVLANPVNNPIRDGNLKTDYEGYADHWVVRATSQFKPHVIGIDGSVVEFPDQIDLYPGCQAVLLLSPWTYDHTSGGKGCGFNLLGIKKVGEGPRLASGGVSAESVQSAFSDVPVVGGSANQW